jgi:hypothetical protein
VVKVVKSKASFDYPAFQILGFWRILNVIQLDLLELSVENSFELSITLGLDFQALRHGLFKKHGFVA